MKRLLPLLLLSALLAGRAEARSTYSVSNITNYNVYALLGDGIRHSPEFGPQNKFGGGNNEAGIKWFSGMDCVITNEDGSIFTFFPEGIVLSTGSAAAGISPGGSNDMDNTPSEAWEDTLTDRDLARHFSRSSVHDVAGILLYVVPSNRTINIPLIVASEEYYLKVIEYGEPTLDEYRDFSDCFAFFVEEGHLSYSATENWFTNNIATLGGDVDLSIGTVNPFTNQIWFVSNVDASEDEWGDLVYNFPSANVPVPFQYNGLMTGPCAVMTNAVPGREYTIKIVVGDGGSVRTVDTAVFLKSKGITSGADLALEMSASPASILDVQDGDESSVISVVKNVGEAPAWGIVLTNSLPSAPLDEWSVPGVTAAFDPDSSAVGSWGRVSAAGEPLVLACKVPDLQSGESWTGMPLRVVFSSLAVDRTNLVVSGCVGTDTGDYDESNNSAEAEVRFPATGTSELSGLVWYDADENGVRSDSETNVVGATVSLFFATNVVAGAEVLPPVFSTNGLYAFRHLTADRYVVRFESPSGFDCFTKKGQGSDPARDSDVAFGEPLRASETDAIDLADGEMLDHVDAGVYLKTNRVAGVKYWIDDDDADGVRPASVDIVLLANGVESSRRPVSPPFGGGDAWPYDFGVVRVFADDGTTNDWSIAEVSVPHYRSLVDDNFCVTNEYVPFGGISGVVFHDADTNGVFAASESPLANVEVRLRFNGEDFAATNTDASGSYAFSGLRLGDYELWFLLPRGFDGTTHGPDSQVEAACPVSIAQLPVSLAAAAPVSTNGAGLYRAMMPVSGVKVWDDAQDNDGLRPSSIALVLSGGSSDSPTNIELSVSAPAGGGDTWPYDFGLVPVYDDLGMENGWTLAEPALPAGYEAHVFGLTAITNVHAVETVDIVAQKVWDDDDDADGERPSSVALTLLRNGVATNTATVGEADGWRASWTVPVLTGGVSNRYDVTESSVPAHYSMSKGGAAPLFEITNSYAPYGRIEGFVWNDADTNGVFAASEAKLAGARVLLDRDGEFAGETRTDASGAYSFDGLRKGAYTVMVFSVEPLESFSHGADSDVEARECAPMSEAVATLGPGSMTNAVNAGLYRTMVVLAGTKTWNDASDQDGIRPSSISLSLVAADSPVATLSVSAPAGGGDEWPFAFDLLPKYEWDVEEGGREIAYTLREGAVSGYTPDVSGFEIVNTHVPGTTNLVAAKVWDDEDDLDGERPASVTFALSSNGVQVATADASDPSWSVEFSDLALRSAGRDILWDVAELSVPAHYAMSKTVSDGVFTVTNAFVPYGRIEGVVWNDANTNGVLEESEAKIPGARVVLALNAFTAETTTGADGSYAFDGLYKGTYAVEVFSVEPFESFSHGDDSAVEAKECAVSSEAFATLEAGSMTNAVGAGLYRATVELSAAKVWDDASDQDGLRPDSVVLSLLADGSSVTNLSLSGSGDEWTVDSIVLPKYAWNAASGGVEIAYSVAEPSPPAGYAASVAGLVITNVHVPATSVFAVEKVWDDHDDDFGLRPASVVFELRAGGAAVTNAVLDESNGWRAQWEVPTFANGSAISYEIVEAGIPSPYALSSARTGLRPLQELPLSSKVLSEDGWRALLQLPVGKKIRTADGWLVLQTTAVGTPVVTEDASRGAILFATNAMPGIGAVSGVVFADADRDGALGASEARLSGVSVELLLDSAPVATATTAGDGSYLFTNLWTGSYAVRFTLPSGYDSTTSGADSQVAAAENVATAEASAAVTAAAPSATAGAGLYRATASVSVAKVWEDASDYDGLRPDSVTLRLSGGSFATNVVLDCPAGADRIVRTVEGLPKFEGGAELSYALSEPAVPAGYEAAVSGLVVVNTHIPVVDLVATKIWDDQDDRDGVRPASLALVAASADGTVSATATATAATGWKATFAGLPRFAADGTEHEYAVSEPVVPAGYAATVSGTDVANAYAPAGAVRGVVWADANCNGVRESSEALLPGVAVTVTTPDETLNLVTDDSGAWSVADCWKGAYTVAVALPDGYRLFSPQDAGNDAVDSDVIGGSGAAAGTLSFSLAARATRVVDAGVSKAQPALTAASTWTLNRSTGLFTSAFVLRNTGNAPFDAATQFWTATAGGANPNWYFYNERNARKWLPDRREYFDLTAAVRSALRSVGNKDAVLDPGESVTVAGPQMYHLKRYNPSKYFVAQDCTFAGVLFSPFDADRNFKISASELSAAQKKWEAGQIPDSDILLLSVLQSAPAYLWNPASRTLVGTADKR